MWIYEIHNYMHFSEDKLEMELNNLGINNWEVFKIIKLTDEGYFNDWTIFVKKKI